MSRGETGKVKDERPGRSNLYHWQPLQMTHPSLETKWITARVTWMLRQGVACWRSFSKGIEHTTGPQGYLGQLCRTHLRRAKELQRCGREKLTVVTLAPRTFP
jgi:hypothetical protein